ncbi:hypothetical protein HYPSUDRAFT_38121 [Hypholoma sublateritium FD-334 SS-4]|uniref:N-acetyltransferase domain-containing protein n=1 Tax=Hypholoma sublateritium (strain FD-334 SS-4) TaxID=945553 RepID=A0A0D2P2L8_HYPSF|nr:hypothetical protein HYPSUDRAFT_38121 [Hypholoma sublateritium FD-334 SS-4]
MADVAIRKIQDITEEEMDKLVILCSRAYEHHQATAIMLGGRQDLRDLLFQSMVGAGALAGELYVMENRNKEMLSMALWFAPGQTIFSSEVQRSKGFNDLMKELDGETKVWWKDQYGRFMSEYVPKVLGKTAMDSWWLNVLATDPDHQGKGYATTLTQEKIKQAAFYNFIGFTTKGYGELPSKFGMLPVWCLAQDVI